MVDIFEEVEGQLRSDRYRTLALKALPWVIGGLVLGLAIALGAWAWADHGRKADAKASEAYVSASEMAQMGDSERAFAKFGEAANAGSEGYEALALMRQAGLRLTQDKTTEAVALLDRAADAADSPVLADLARLQAVYALMDAGSMIEIEGRLKVLQEEGRPYRAHAREALAIARMSAGRAKEARQTFVLLSQGLDTPQDVRERAGAAIGMIDSGLAATLPQVLKAAKTAAAEPAGQPSLPQAGTAQ